MRLFSYPGLVLALAALPYCASSAWREGFTNEDTLQLVGEGHAKADLPQIQGQAMAREAAIMDAMSHWPKFCPAQDVQESQASAVAGQPPQSLPATATQQIFRIENQKKRIVDCEAGSCRAKIIIEKTNLRGKCSG